MTKLDDSLDVFGVHGVGGLWGGIATGLFATTAVSGLTYEGLFYGDAGQMVDQVAAMAIVAVYSFVVTTAILKVLDVTLGLRVKEEEEEIGLDVTQHGERGYDLEEGGAIPMIQYEITPEPAPSAQAQARPESASSGV
jgi:Amt family ammonium transporter